MQEWRWVCSKRFPLIQLPRKSEVRNGSRISVTGLSVSINSTSEEVRRRFFGNLDPVVFIVSINSTSEEVRSSVYSILLWWMFRVSINSTSEEVRSVNVGIGIHPHITVSINSTSEEVRRSLQQLEKGLAAKFPLIQLPRKSEVLWKRIGGGRSVSINSTSEEVRSFIRHWILITSAYGFH